MHGCRVSLREIWIVTECLLGVSSHFWFCFCFFSTFKSTKDFHKALLRSTWNLNSYTIFIACLLSLFWFHITYICCVGFTTKSVKTFFPWNVDWILFEKKRLFLRSGCILFFNTKVKHLFWKITSFGSAIFATTEDFFSLKFQFFLDFTSRRVLRLVVPRIREGKNVESNCGGEAHVIRLLKEYGRPIEWFLLFLQYIVNSKLLTFKNIISPLNIAWRQ